MKWTAPVDIANMRKLECPALERDRPGSNIALFPTTLQQDQVQAILMVCMHLSKKKQMINSVIVYDTTDCSLLVLPTCSPMS